tara:strand:- start:68826 stop:69755 length:930 start_codon:yes stop_codon:yes gene_type:complete
MIPGPDIHSDLKDISSFIGKSYYLRDFPKEIDERGFLIPSDLPPRDNGVRRIHGYLNACRTAALIPHIAALYLANKDKFDSELQAQMDEVLSPDNIKILQVTALMRATGRMEVVKPDGRIRHPDLGPGKFHRERGVKECEKMLNALKVDEATSKKFAQSISDSEEFDKKGMNIFTCILADATTMETLRDTLVGKVVGVNYFAYTNRFKEGVDSTLAEKMFTDFVIDHMKLIKEHQGFLLADLVTRDKASIAGLQIELGTECPDKPLAQQVALETDPDCFLKAEKDVNTTHSQRTGVLEVPTAAKSRLGR